ncbi:MAG: radical SAM protein [Bacillota bacterium]
MIKLSVGTAHILGMKRLRTDAPPTTAYLLIGEGCSNNCSFCSQAQGSKASKDDLSRVKWEEYEPAKIIEKLAAAADRGDVERICMQAVDNQQVEEEVSQFLEELTAKVDLPISVSKSISSVEEVGELLAAGVSNVNIALDAVNPEHHCEIKDGSYQEKYELLLAAAREFPNQISTHIIVGLGESEEEIIDLLVKLKELQVEVGVFAFTPLPGTKLANHARPDLHKYRRIQVANHLIDQHDFKLADFEFSSGQLIDVDLATAELIDLLADGKAFHTIGCEGCNRPYYNEKPGGVIYNYPRDMEEEEIKQAILESELVTEDEWPGI